MGFFFGNYCLKIPTGNLIQLSYISAMNDIHVLLTKRNVVRSIPSRLMQLIFSFLLNHSFLMHTNPIRCVNIYVNK